jgi:hypothetical protein
VNPENADEYIVVEAVYVAFDTDGGSEAPETQKIAKGAKAEEPAEEPTKDGGFFFDGWYNGETNKPWFDEENEDPALGYGPGVYNDTYLYNQYKKYLNGEGSDIIIGTQHFDYGAENFEFDITDYVNKVLSGELINHGLGLAFSPDYEQYDYLNDKVFTPARSFKACEVSGVVPQYYIGFFTNHTNLFFEPYMESDYDVHINDDRQKFFRGKENKLYLYCNVGGDLVNLDELPVCTIEGVEYPVQQTTKGVYYATV